MLPRRIFSTHCLVGFRTARATPFTLRVPLLQRNTRSLLLAPAATNTHAWFHSSPFLRSKEETEGKDDDPLNEETIAKIKLAAAKLKTAPYKSYLGEVEAFAARVDANFDFKVLIEALTHKSFVENVFSCNDNFAFIGRNVLESVVSEYVYTSYPRLNPATWRSIITAYTGPVGLLLLAKNIGIEYVVRWEPPVSDEEKIEASQRVCIHSIHSLIGAMHCQLGGKATRDWIDKFILSRRVEVEPLIVIKRPVQLLASMVQSRGLPPLEFRMINESARLSNKSMFVVGAYSGTELLGEGTAGRIADAEKLAARDALLKYYLAPIKSAERDANGQITKIPLENVMEL